MTTSGTTDSTLTARQIIQQAFDLLGIGGTTEANNFLVGLRSLNFMLKSWQADGCNLWRDKDAIVTWPADTPNGTLDPNFIDVFDVLWISGPTYERQLVRWEKGEYDTLPNKISAGNPTVYMVHKTRDGIQMYLWPVPTEETFLKCDVATILEDVTGLDQTLDIPQMWIECAYYSLADRLMPTFGTPNQQISTTALQLYSAMRDYDRPGSINMGPW